LSPFFKADKEPRKSPPLQDSCSPRQAREREQAAQVRSIEAYLSQAPSPLASPGERVGVRGALALLRDYIADFVQAQKSGSRMRGVVIAGRAWGALMKATQIISSRFDPVGRYARRVIAPTG